MTSAEERAKKIVTYCAGRDIFNYRSGITDFITAQIAEAEREAKDWVMMQHAKLRRETWFMDGYKKGWTAAREKAKEIIREGCNDGDIANCPDCGNLDGERLAERIEKMEPGK